MSLRRCYFFVNTLQNVLIFFKNWFERKFDYSLSALGLSTIAENEKVWFLNIFFKTFEFTQNFVDNNTTHNSITIWAVKTCICSTSENVKIKSITKTWLTGSLDRISLDRNCVLSVDQNFHNQLTEIHFTWSND